eukprot:scaffold581834_cov24-Prasinocladus_malaysianus.AAC.2
MRSGSISMRRPCGTAKDLPPVAASPSPAGRLSGWEPPAIWIKAGVQWPPTNIGSSHSTNATCIKHHAASLKSEACMKCAELELTCIKILCGSCESYDLAVYATPLITDFAIQISSP